MSYTILKAISIEGNKVITSTAAHSDKGKIYAQPLNFQEKEDKVLSAVFKKDGLHGVLKVLGEQAFRGDLAIQPHNCLLADKLLYAKNMIQPPLSFYLTPKYAGEFIATAAEGMATQTFYSPVLDYKKLDALRSDPDAAMDICAENPRAFNFTESNIRRNHDMAMRYIDQCIAHPDFVIPSFFVDDKEVAMRVLKHDGRLFKDLGKQIQNDPTVALYAYSNVAGRLHHCSDPSYLGPNLLQNNEFLCDLCAACEDLKIQNRREILMDPKVTETWLNYNRWAFDYMQFIPVAPLKYKKVRDALYNLAGEDYGRKQLVDMYLAASLPDHCEEPSSLDERVSDAQSRADSETKTKKKRSSSKTTKNKTAEESLSL